jgi:hypothetical protein
MSTKVYSLVTTMMLVVLFVGSCKKEESAAAAPVEQKVLNKSTISPKKWHSQGSSVILDLKAGGVFGDLNGTWKWKNSSDTLEVVTQAGFPVVLWKIHWNTSTEMQGERVDNKIKIDFKDKPW